MIEVYDVKVVIINGYPGSGKDAFVSLCCDFNRNTFNIHTSDQAKNALMRLGWDGEKTPEARKLLADMMVLSYKYDGPFKYVSEQVNYSKLHRNAVLFVHCREPHNIIVLRDMFDATTLFIDRDSVVPTTEKYYNNASDNFAGECMDIYKYVIPNNGTIEDLNRAARSFMSLIRGELAVL